MKKNLIALALSAAFIAPAAMADVTIYGTMSASVESVKATGATDSTKDLKSVNRVSSNVSKIGFKGNEDLGNGLKAIWQVEQEISIDDGGTRKGSFASRNSFVGLDGQFGKVLLGNNDSAYKTLVKPVNPLADTIADTCTDKAVFCRGDARLTNSVHYFTPNFAGFQAGVSYGTDETRNALPNGERARNDRWSVGASYDIAGFNFGLGYDRTNDGAKLGDSAANNAAINSSAYWKAVAKYTFGDTQIGAGFERQTTDYKAAGVEDVSQNAWTVGAIQKFGAFGVGLSYVKLRESKSDAKDGADQWTLAGTYDLSKRTQTYAYYTRIDNDANQNRTFGNAGLDNVGKGANPTGFGIGMKHMF